MKHTSTGVQSPALENLQSSVEPYGADPLVIAEAEGAYIIDTQGRRYLDAVSGYWVACLGHGDPELTSLMSTASRRLSYWHHCGTVHEPAVNYVSCLFDHVAESLRGKVLFAATGSGSMENALRVACARDVSLGRETVLGHLDRGYHGSTFLAQQLSPDRWNDWPASLRLQPHQTVCLPTPETEEDSAAVLGQLEEGLRRGTGPTILVTEPILGVGGVLEPPPTFFRALRDLASVHRVTWISDEISTGFGATGRLFAYENSEAVPDVLVVGKKMSGGYFPITASIVGAQLAAEVLSEVFHHGYSYSGHPVGCEVARAVLQRVAADDMLLSIRRKGELLKKELQQSLDGVVPTGGVRGRGLMVSVDLQSGRRARSVGDRLRKLGIYEITEGRYLVFCPPYITTDSELAWLAEATGQAVRAEES